MAVKAINNIARPNGLVLTLLIFGAYLCIPKFDALTTTITKHVTAIKNVMKEVQKVRAKK